MKQVVSHLDTGEIELIDVPRPRPGRGEVLVANRYSVVSAGTERMLVSFGAASWPGKARQQPERLVQLLDKARSDGLGATVEAVRARLSAPVPLGYSAAGVVLEVGADVDLRPGDRVATNSPHAEAALVRARLAAKIPAEVSDRDAAFTTVGAIALNALRATEVGVGGTVAVIGLGLIGRLTMQVALAAGCRAIGLDLDPARANGAFSNPDDFARSLDHVTSGIGADAVIVTASADRKTLQHAAAITRKRGAIVLVGAGDPTLDRRLFYERELRFSVAHAYGAGRDEPDWERGVIDYPAHRVRWTAQRNFEAFLDLCARGRLDLPQLELEEVDFADAHRVYTQLREGPAAVATLFRYADATLPESVALPPRAIAPGAPTVSVIGAGNFATRVLLPLLAEHDLNRVAIASRGGLTAAQAGRKFGFSRASTSADDLLRDADLLFIASPHDSHVDHATTALNAGKHVWLEKPLALDRAGLDLLAAAAAHHTGVLMVGFNRRFAPTMRALYDRTRDLGPLSMVYTVHAPPLSPDHWLLDRTRGGGRLIGEACHFVDALRFLAGAPIVRAFAAPQGDGGSLHFAFADGSTGSVHYITTGHPSLPKERLEVSTAGASWTVDNFRSLHTAGEFSPAQRLKSLGAPQDKGHAAAIAAFLGAVRTGRPSPIPFAESLEVSRAIFDALDAAECFT